jgi:hypothetical protein
MKNMNNITIAMVNEAEAKFEAYCKEHGMMGKVQVQMENEYLALKKAYNIRCAEVANRIRNKGVIVWSKSDEYMSYAAANIVQGAIVAEIVEVFNAYENNDLREFQKAVAKVKTNRNINHEALLQMLI